MRHSRIVVIALLAALAGAPLAACTGSETTESTGEYIDDSVISNKVRAELIGDADLNVFQIDVSTYKGVVQLSGFVDTQEAKDRASDVVSRVAGVKKVHNDLVVKP